eukprot:SAG11_NODE_510_length_8851_cov_25.360718_10_plen_87_part_00
MSRLVGTAKLMCTSVRAARVRTVRHARSREWSLRCRCTRTSVANGVCEYEVDAECSVIKGSQHWLTAGNCDIDAECASSLCAVCEQ